MTITPPAEWATWPHGRVGPPLPAEQLRANPFAYGFALFHFDPPPADFLRETGRLALEAGIVILAKPKALPEPHMVVRRLTGADASGAPTREELDAVDARLTKEQLTRLAACPAATSFAIGAPLEQCMTAYRRALELGREIERFAPGVFWDGGCERPLSRAQWSDRLRGDHEGVPDVRRHIEVQAHDDQDGLRMLTVGMCRFGLFDLEISGLEGDDADDAAVVLCLAAQLLTEREALEEAGYLTLDIDAVRNPTARADLVEASGRNRRAMRVALALKDAFHSAVGDEEEIAVELVFERAANEPSVVPAYRQAFDRLLGRGGA